MSDDHSWNDNDAGDEYTQRGRKKSGFSVTKIVLIVLAVIGGLGMLCCCGGFFFVQQAIPKVTNDPAEIAVIADEIVSLELHKELTAHSGMTQSTFGIVDIKFVMYSTSDGSGEMIVVRFDSPSKVAKDSRGGFDKEFKESLPQFDSSKKTTETILVDGNPVVLSITSGTERGTADPLVHVQGALVDTPEKVISFIITSTSETFNKEAIIEMIKTMKPK